MKIRLYEDISTIPLNESTWNDLVSKNETNTIFQTYQWFISWWQSFGIDKNLLFLVAYENKKIVAFAPLMILNEYFCKRVIKFVGDGNSDYSDFVITGNKHKAIYAFMDYIYINVNSWTEINLKNIPNYSTTRSCIETYHLSKNSHLQILNSTTTPTLLLKNNPIFAKKITKKYSIMRHVRKLDNQGQVDVVHLRKPDEIKKHINEFFSQHIERYNHKNSGSLFENLNNCKFYIKLIDRLKNRDILLFSVLYLDKKPIAFHYGYTYNNILIWYKPSFDINYKSYSPGTILLKHLIEYANNNSFDELDFTIGDEEFKSRFSNFKRENHNLSIYKSYTLYSLYHMRHHIGIILGKIRAKLKNK